MFNPKSIELVKELQEAEKENALKYGSIYHSVHEAYAILLEEIEEAADELDAIENYIKPIWQEIKKDEIENSIIQKLVLIGISTDYLILEAAQIHAVVDKFIETVNKETKENGK